MALLDAVLGVTDAIAERTYRLADLGGAVPAKNERTPAKFDAFVKAEIARWSPILKAASVTAN